MAIYKFLVDENQCPNCGIEVYQAEALLAGNSRWHKRCFKCCYCNKFLNTSNCNVHQGFLFCKHCLEEVTRYDRPQIYPDTTAIKPESEKTSCPRCGGKVFEAEKVVEKGKTYHKRCFTCVKCHRPQDDKLQVFVGEDSDVYCKSCYPKLLHTPLPVDPNLTSKIRPESHYDIDGCPRCGGKVFDAERIIMGNSSYHQRCFLCRVCYRPMDSMNSVAHQNDIFCHNCFRQHFDGRAKSAGPANTAAIPGDFSRRDCCPRCGGIVFEAEKVGARYRDYHKRCLSCAQCGHKLDATNFNDAPDGDVYCRHCYNTKFRAKSTGAGDVRAIGAPEGDAARCPRCAGRVFQAEKVISRYGWYHGSCLKCFRCDKLMDQTNFNDAADGNVYCGACYRTLDVRDRNLTALSLVDTTRIQGIGEKSEACPRCRGKVFEAEKKVARSGVYHVRCFSCRDCQRPLDGLRAVDGPQGHIFCEPCYKKGFGPSELRVQNQQQSQKSTDTTVIQPSDKSQGCVRCGGAVFEAEKITSKGFVFHTKCTTCHNCGKRLNSSTLNAGFAADPEIYCSGCYGRLYGGVGYRGSHGDHSGGQWLDERTAVMNRPSQYVNPGALKAANGEESCNKCGGKVFELERFVSNSGIFHRQCFNCGGCSKKLDSSLVYHFEAPDGKVYCKKCFRERFGDGVKPMIYSNPGAIVDPSGSGCPRCGGMVFEAERFPASNTRNYHVSCATCKTCNHKLDASSVNCGPDKDIYCPGCYSRNFGNAGYRGAQANNWLDIEANVLLRPAASTTKHIVSTNPDDPNACPRCRGLVYEAEKFPANNRNYHLSCLRCKSCDHKLDASSLNCGSDKEIYCPGCYSRKFGNSGYRGTLGNNWLDENANTILRPATVNNVVPSAIPADPGDPNACPRCGGKVFEAEKLTSRERSYHKQCFTCAHCSHGLDYTTCAEGPNADIYCKTCYGKEYFTGGRNRFGDVSSLPAGYGEKGGCRRCGKQVFEVDKVMSKNGAYHKMCLNCSFCKRQLEAGTVFDGPEDVYCQSCYSDRFGVKGRGKAVGQISMRNEEGFYGEKDANQCPRCGGKVYEAEKMTTSVGVFHPGCFKCVKCPANLDQSSATCGDDGEIYCQLCYKEEFGVLCRRRSVRSRSRPGSRANSRPSSVMGRMAPDGEEDPVAKAVVDTTAIMASPGDPDACPKCRGKVFEAEKMVSTQGSFHKKCFVCNECNRALDQSSVVESSEEGLGVIYCKNCFGKKRFLLQSKYREDVDLQASKPLDPSKACQRCGGGVFAAEEFSVESGRVYHDRCAKCFSCRRKLEAKSLFSAPDKEIYCQGCYGKKFGVAVFRGNLTNQWGDEQSCGNLRGSSADTSSVIKAQNEAEGCRRCVGRVFDAEKVFSSHGMYHSNCFKCFECGAKLDSMKACDGNDKEVYCKNCYSKKFGLSGFGYGRSLTSVETKSAQYHFTEFF